jgi:ADP-heptose:LPS heptosyltransferase
MTHATPVLQRFGEHARAASSILVVHQGALGDTLQQLPALRVLRLNNPAVELHLAGSGVARMAELLPWIDGFTELPGRLRLTDIPRVWRLIAPLRRRRFDLSICLLPRNTSVVINRLCGARFVASRQALPHKARIWPRLWADAVLPQPWFVDGYHRENRALLAACGLQVPEDIDFGLVADAGLRRAAGLGAEHDGRYLHVSPFATDDSRDLPPAVLAAVLNTFHALTGAPVVISVLGDERQRRRLAPLREALDFAPLRVFEGGLSTAAFVSVVAGCRVHLGPDSGGIHVARATGRPVTAWFRVDPQRPEYIHYRPYGADTRVLTVVHDGRQDEIRDLPAATLAAALLDLWFSPMRAPETLVVNE